MIYGCGLSAARRVDCGIGEDLQHLIGLRRRVYEGQP
jgi:hypothetical protein